MIVQVTSSKLLKLKSTFKIKLHLESVVVEMTERILYDVS